MNLTLFFFFFSASHTHTHNGLFLKGEIFLLEGRKRRRVVNDDTIRGGLEKTNPFILTHHAEMIINYSKSKKSTIGDENVGKNDFQKN